jgi:hypothetical protein
MLGSQLAIHKEANSSIPMTSRNALAEVPETSTSAQPREIPNDSYQTKLAPAATE